MRADYQRFLDYSKKYGTLLIFSFIHYLKMLSFLSSIFYLAMAGAIIGSVSAYENAAPSGASSANQLASQVHVKG